MDRKLWLYGFGGDKCPAWKCAVCQYGRITLLPDTVINFETVASVAHQKTMYSSPEEIDLNFSAWAICDRCSQHYSIAGVGGIDRDFDDDGRESGWSPYYLPKYCNPMPRIFEFTPECPKNVRKELESAFSLYWDNLEACAAKIRVALERLMDELGIPAELPKRGGGARKVILDERLLMYAENNPKFKVLLMTLKAIGNAGSHGESMAREDLLNAFEIIEHVLDEMYSNKIGNISKLVLALEEKFK